MLLRNRTADLFDEMFNDSFFRSTSDKVPDIMKTDIQEKDGQYLIEIELPGYEKENIKAELKDGYLTIIATKVESIEKEEIKVNYIRRERYVGTAKRTFFVGDHIKETDIAAAFKRGVLTIMVAKKDPSLEKNATKLIPIK